MRRIILFTIFLFITAIAVTVFYFSKIKLPGQNTENVIKQIPQNAVLVFEFKNDPEFFELFKENQLFTSFIGQKKSGQLKYLYNRLLKPYSSNMFPGNKSIYISLHPELKSNDIDMLLTSGSDGINNLQEVLSETIQQNGGKLKSEKIGNKMVQRIDFTSIKEAFYLTENAHVLAGSFNKDLVLEFLDERAENKINNLVQLSDQQNKNSIANLYVNYQQFPVLFKQLFRFQNDDFFRLITNFPATAALSLNFRSDALLFNGYTKADTIAATYLNLFLKLQPVNNTLKAIYPVNTASAINFAYAKPTDYLSALYQWQIKQHQNLKAKNLFIQIQQETGINIQTAFAKQLDKEFAVLTTAENEKIAIIKVKNGSQLEPFLRNISVNPESSLTQFKYQNLPFYLLGEPFLHFKQPYFVLIDNYLLLANSQSSINRYLSNYQHQHFLNEDRQYYNFNALLAEKSSITLFMHFPNSFLSLKSQLQPEFSRMFNQKNVGWRNYFATAVQFTASDNSFYTSFYLQQKNNSIKDTTAL